MSSTRTPYLAPNLEEKIRARAYELFQKRGAEHGRALDDWLEAEADILKQKFGPVPIGAGTPPKRTRGKRNGG